MSSKPTNAKDHRESGEHECGPARRSPVSLPILQGHGEAGGGKGGTSAWSAGHPIIAKSRSARWRALVLILVHVVIGLHIVQWLITGMTLSPVEPSESMQTLREGTVNTGFVFFAAAIASTLVLGRWFCGWGCHIVALQDWCAWLMARARVKPRPFRSRLLVYIPLFMALYMFVWPVFHREVIRPLFMDAQGNLPLWLGQSEPLHRVTTEFLVDDFWATFPPWYIAVPFLFICTFGCVYFLGSKGYCTYACPYGGIFGPADLVAPGRIRVTDACNGCGHCTAVCTANVRVHEEVRDYGMVIDPGCMKHLDCVSVCPNDALYFGFGRPAVGAKPKHAARLTEEEAARAKTTARANRAARFDLKPWEEWVLFAVWFGMFYGFRGLAHQVPMLLALGLAAVGAFCVWKLWQMLRLPNVRLQGWQLRVRGRVTAAGVAVAVLALATAAVAAWSGYVKTRLFQAELNHAMLTTPLGTVLRPDFEPSPRELAHARDAIRHYHAAGPWSEGNGGVGWSRRADAEIDLAYLYVLTGERQRAEALLRKVIDTGEPRDALIFQAAQLMRARNASEDEILAMYTAALAAHPRLDGIRAQISGWHFRNGRMDESQAIWDEPLAERPDDPKLLLSVAEHYRAAGNRAKAVELLDRAVGLIDPAHEPETLLRAATQFALLGGEEESADAAGKRLDRAVELATLAAGGDDRRGGSSVSAGQLLTQIGKGELGLPLVDRGVERATKLGPHTGKAQTLLTAGILLINVGKLDDGLALVRRAADMLAPVPGQSPAYGPFEPWDLVSIAGTLSQMGMGFALQPLKDEAIALAARARDLEPLSPTLNSDLALMLYAAGKRDQALAEMTKAAELSRGNAIIPRRLAQLLEEVGRPDDARSWHAIANQRASAPPPP